MSVRFVTYSVLTIMHQSLELSQIETIVQEIEREKEAGTCKSHIRHTPLLICMVAQRLSESVQDLQQLRPTRQPWRRGQITWRSRYFWTLFMYNNHII